MQAVGSIAFLGGAFMAIPGALSALSTGKGRSFAVAALLVFVLQAGVFLGSMFGLVNLAALFGAAPPS